MAAAAWLMNLGFAGGTATATTPDVDAAGLAQAAEDERYVELVLRQDEELLLIISALAEEKLL